MWDLLFGGASLATGGVAGIIGSVMGLGARLVPEIMKHFQDRRDKRHELDMLKLQIDSADKMAKLRMDEARQSEEYKLDGKALEALLASVTSQFAVTTGTAAQLSASVRPIITFWCFALYTIAKGVIAGSAIYHGAQATTVANLIWTPTDEMLLAGIVNFWFLDRVLRRRGA